MKKWGKLCLILGMAGCLLAGSVCTVQAEEYLYDALNRVIRVTYDDGSYVEYTYDKNGNITGVDVHKTGPTEPEQTIKTDDADSGTGEQSFGRTETIPQGTGEDKAASSTAASDRETRMNGEEASAGKNEGETKGIQGTESPEGAEMPEGSEVSKEAAEASEETASPTAATPATPAKGPGFWEKLFRGIKSLWERFVQWVRSWF